MPLVPLDVGLPFYVPTGLRNEIEGTGSTQIIQRVVDAKLKKVTSRHIYTGEALKTGLLRDSRVETRLQGLRWSSSHQAGVDNNWNVRRRK